MPLSAVSAGYGIIPTRKVSCPGCSGLRRQERQRDAVDNNAVAAVQHAARVENGSPADNASGMDRRVQLRPHFCGATEREALCEVERPRLRGGTRASAPSACKQARTEQSAPHASL